MPSQCVHTNYHTNPFSFNTRKRAPFLMNRPATNVRLVSRHTPTLRWSSERGKAVYSLSSVVTNELDSHVSPPAPRRHAYTPYFTTKASHTLCTHSFFIIYYRGAPSAAHLQLALPPARCPLPVRPHPPARILPTPYPALIYICLCAERAKHNVLHVGVGHSACRTRVGDRHARVAGCGDLGRQSP